MYYIITLIRSKTIIIFIITVLAVIFLEYGLLMPVLDIGLTPEDREFVLRYKLIGPNPIVKILEAWSDNGAYTTVPIYYVGMVANFTDFNYFMIQLIGIIFKTLATISVFPLVFLIFKNKWLAAVTTILVAISYPTAGALETGAEQTEYVGFLMMNIFLIAYYYLNTRYLLQFKWLFFTSLLLFIAVIASVMRVFPILFLLPVIEVYLWLRNRARYRFRYLVIKLALFYIPFLILVYFFPSSATGHFALPTILSKINIGNWQLILIPLQGLGLLIPVSGYYGLLGHLELNNFYNYLVFLLGSPLIIFGGISFLLCWITTHKPLYLFLRIFILNLGFDILLYFIVQHRLSIPLEMRLDYDTPRLYPVFIGLFTLSIAINFFIEWYRQGKENNYILLLWLGPFISFFYITVTYSYANLDLSFSGAQAHYLLIPTLGISLLTGEILLSFYNKLRNSIIGLSISIFLIATILLILYALNKELISEYFNGAKIKGRAAAGQIEMQTKIKQRLKNFDYSKPLMVYFDTSEISGDGPFYSESLLTPFPFFMHLDGDKVLDGCIGVIYNNNEIMELKKLIKVRNGQKSIVHPAFCVDGYNIKVNNIAINLVDLYAFKIRNREFIDIKNQLLDQLDVR